MKKNILSIIIFCTLSLQTPTNFCMNKVVKLARYASKLKPLVTLGTMIKTLAEESKLIKQPQEESVEKNVMILNGSLCSGKTTIAGEAIKAFDSCKKICVGDLLREQAQWEEQLRSGQMIDDTYINNLVKENLSNLFSDGKTNLVIIDGYPRTFGQARSFLHLIQYNPHIKKFHLVWLHTSNAFIKKYALNRASCPECLTQYIPIEGSPYQPLIENCCNECGTKLQKRNDDTLKTVTKRLLDYKKNTVPVLKTLEKHHAATPFHAYLSCTPWNPLANQIENLKRELAYENGDI